MDVIALARKGDVDAFEKLVVKYQRMLFNISYRMLDSYEDAGEVVQDAFLSAYRNLDAFKGMSRFSTWLCSIVINLSKNKLLQSKTMRRHEAYSLDDPVEAEDGPIARDIASGEPSVVETLEKEEVRRKVQNCIGGLESEFKEVVVLRDIRGFSYDEVSEILRIPEGTVKSRLFRARNALKDCLKKVMGKL